MTSKATTWLVDMVVLVLGAAAGLVFPLALFLRGRSFYAESGWVDFAVLGACAVVPVVVQALARGKVKPGAMLLAGSLLMVGIAFAGLLVLPAAPFPASSLPAIDVHGTPVQPGTFIYSLVVAAAMLVAPSLVSLARSVPRGPSSLVLAMSLAGGLLLAGAGLVDGGNGLVAMLGIVSGGLAVIVAGSRHGPVPSARVTAGSCLEPLSFSPIRPGAVVSIIVSWVLLAALLAGAFLVLVQAGGVPHDTVAATLVGLVFFPGFLPAGLVAMVASWRPVRLLAGIVAGGGLLAVAFWALGEHPASIVPLAWLVLGVPLGLVTWGFIENATVRGSRGTTGVMLLVPLLVAGFVSYMVMEPGELLSLLSVFATITVTVTIIEGINAVAGLARGRRELVGGVA